MKGGNKMSKFLCANLDKEEYLDFGVYSNNIFEESPACDTLEYFLATEWSKDRIIFFFEENEKSNIFPDEENAYDFVIQNYSERTILNTVPKYKYIANISNKEYYFKAALPQKDSNCICPLPFILTEKESNILEDNLEDNESQELGRWIGGSIIATNNRDFCNGYKLFESPYAVRDTAGKVLDGLNIVVTGTISGFTRSDIENHIRNYGGNPQNSVTRRTDFVVVADYRPGTKKINDAKKYGIRTITEREFFDMLEE